MNFVEAIQSGFSNYVNFSGRAQRSAYWWWFLFVIIVDIVASLIDGMLGVQIVAALAGLAMLLPSIAVGVRRLHDLDKSGWWLLIGLIPLIGAIVLIIFFVQKGTTGPNRFGPDPPGGA